ncbi:hypothetical protein, partial [Enterococcus faecium]|uniref:hypothetical protein n=1 Tax=Enterococcus faecium TaxID=1352 RepID=UPI003F4447A0
MIDRAKGCVAGHLSEAIDSHREEMRRFADVGKPRFSTAMNELWASAFPMVLPPDQDDGLGIVLL